MYIFIALILVVSIVSAQEMPKDTILSKKEIKQKKKEEKEAKLQKQFEKNYQILNDKAFVLEANKIDSYYDVSPWLNFLLVDSTNFLLQVSSTYGASFNGLGGSTITGKIINYQLTKKEKHKTCFLHMMVEVNFGKFDITIDVTSSGAAKATILWLHGSIVYDGNIVLLNESQIRKGTIFFK